MRRGAVLFPHRQHRTKRSRASVNDGDSSASSGRDGAQILWQSDRFGLIISLPRPIGRPFHGPSLNFITIGLVILGAEEHFTARADKTVLCIDDHKSAVAGWCLYVQSAGYRVETAFSATEGLQLFATQQIDLALLDYSMPDANGG